MSYDKALQAAGAEVLEFQKFGSYQGDWWAKVRYKGELGWVNGCFGSCSACDSFESEFGYGEDKGCRKHIYDYRDDCPACRRAIEEYNKRLADFGKVYLDGLLTQEQAEKEAARNIEWDSEAPEMLEWLKAHTLKPLARRRK